MCLQGKICSYDSIKENNNYGEIMLHIQKKMFEIDNVVLQLIKWTFINGLKKFVLELSQATILR